MIKEIVKDTTILSQTSRKFENSNFQIITDLLETAIAHKGNCAGLAAIQIGEAVRCFVVATGPETYVAVINPMILKRSPETYTATESCLSLEGAREVRRNRWIDVIYSNEKGKFIKTRLSGFTAQVFQHEYDHLEGKLI